MVKKTERKPHTLATRNESWATHIQSARIRWEGTYKTITWSLWLIGWSCGVWSVAFAGAVMTWSPPSSWDGRDCLESMMRWGSSGIFFWREGAWYLFERRQVLTPRYLCRKDPGSSPTYTITRQLAWGGLVMVKCKRVRTGFFQLCAIVSSRC